jgi:hypothetical protein
LSANASAYQKNLGGRKGGQTENFGKTKKIKNGPISLYQRSHAVFLWWKQMDSNHRPLACQVVGDNVFRQNAEPANAHAGRIFRFFLKT